VSESCQGKACVGVQVCDAELSLASRTLALKPPRRPELRAGAIHLEAGNVLTKALCTNPAPNVRRAVSCSAQGFLPNVSGETNDASGAGPTCDAMFPPDMATRVTRERVRRFAAGNNGGQMLALPLNLNGAARQAIKDAYRKSGRTSVVICVTFAFNDGKQVTLTRTLPINVVGGRGSASLGPTARALTPAPPRR
jgi:hypothetical protein